MSKFLWDLNCINISMIVRYRYVLKSVISHDTVIYNFFIYNISKMQIFQIIKL